MMSFTAMGKIFVLINLKRLLELMLVVFDVH